eukprot:gene35193-16838_t
MAYADACTRAGEPQPPPRLPPSHPPAGTGPCGAGAALLSPGLVDEPSPRATPSAVVIAQRRGTIMGGNAAKDDVDDLPAGAHALGASPHADLECGGPVSPSSPAGDGMGALSPTRRPFLDASPPNANPLDPRTPSNPLRADSSPHRQAAAAVSGWFTPAPGGAAKMAAGAGRRGAARG